MRALLDGEGSVPAGMMKGGCRVRKSSYVEAQGKGCTAMPLPEHLIENVVTAVISGGGTALSTIIAFFQGVKKKVEEVEKKVGSIETRSGLVFAVLTLEETVKQMRHEISGWATHPPEWLVQAVSRSRRVPSLHGYDVNSGDLEDRIRGVENRLKDFEDTLERMERKLKGLVSEEEFDSADRARAEEIATVRTMVAEVNGLLKGLQTALTGRR